MRKSFLIALVVLVVAGVGGYFAVTRYIQYEARKQVDALFSNLKAGGIDAGHGGVDFDLFDSRLDIRDMTFSAAGQGTLRIAAFQARGLSQPAGDRVAAERIELTDVAFDGPLPFSPGVAASYRLPQIEVTGFEGPTEIVASGPQPWRIALAMLEATSARKIAIPAATGTTRVGTGDSRIETDIVYGAFTLDTLVEGKIAKMVAEPTRFTVSGAPNAAAHGEIGRSTSSAVDFGPVLMLLDPERRRAEQAFRTVYGSIDIDSYSITSDGGLAQSWASVRITDVAIKPSAIPAEALMLMVERIQELTARSEPVPPDEMADMLRSLTGAYDGVQIGGATLSKFTSTQPDGTKAALDELKVGSFDGGTLREFSMRGGRGIDADGRPFKFDTLAIGGLRPGAIMELAAGSLDKPQAAGDTASLMGMFAIFDSFELLRAQVSFEAGQEPVVLDKLTLSWTAADNALPTSFSAILRLSGPTDALQPGDVLLQVLPENVARASVAVDLGAQWDEAQSTVTLSPLYAEVSDAFSFSAALALKDVDRSLFSNEPAAMLSAALAANLASAEVAVSDAGLYERKLGEAAKQQGMDAESVRQLLAGFAELLLAQTVADRPELDPAVQALVAFLQKPMGKLALRFTPREATLPVLTIVQTLQQDPTALIDQINVQVIDAP